MVEFITDPALRGLKAGQEIRVGGVKGLIARRQTADGDISFVLTWTTDGVRRKHTIGRYPAMTLKRAREEADKIRNGILLGRPPGVSTDAPSTVNDLIRDYGKALTARGARSAATTIRYLEKHVAPTLGRQKLAHVERQDLTALFRRLDQGATVAKFFKAAWRHGLNEGYIDRDIVSSMRIPSGRKGPRGRVLSDNEIAGLMRDWWTGEVCRSAFCAVFALGLLTGGRRSEISEMRWSEIDGDLVRLPADRMKSGKPGFLVLSSFALSIVASLPRTHEEFVFPTPYKPRSGTRGDVRPGRAGRGTISGFTPAHNATMKRTGITGWVPHDTRRTFATGLVRLGAPPHVADAAINHAAPLLVRTYQVHTHEAEIRRWAEAWGAHVKALLTR